VFSNFGPTTNPLLLPFLAFPLALIAPLSPLNSEKLFLIISTTLLTSGGLPPAVLFHPGLCGVDFPAASPSGPAGVSPARGARSTATHAWPPSPTPSRSDVFLTFTFGPHSFTIRVGSRDEVIAVSRLKAYTAMNGTPCRPRHRGRPPGSQPGGPAATKQILFSDPLVS
jgi:hypothetical protein